MTEYKCVRCEENCIFSDDDMQLCCIDKIFYVDQYLEEIIE